MARRALVTGGGGFIGRSLVASLLADGFDVVVVDDFSRRSEGAAGPGDHGRLEVIEADLTRPVDPAAIGPISHLFHLAAIVGVQQALTEPERVLGTNIAATTQAVELARRLGPEVFFLSSTSEVNDGAASAGLATVPVPEDAPFVSLDPQAPRSSYAVSKVVSEMLCGYLAGDGVKVRIARYHNVYGPDMGERHVIPQLIGRILDRIDPFPLYGAGQTRAYCHISDAVEATRRLADCDGDAVEIANIGDDTEEIRAVDLAERLFRLSGFRPTLDIHEPPPGSPERRCPDLGRLRALTGYEPRVGLDAGLAEALAAATARSRPGPGAPVAPVVGARR